MGNQKGIQRSDFDNVTKRKEDKSKWKWLVRVDKLEQYLYDKKGGVPLIIKWFPLPEFIHITTGDTNQEFELIDALTTDRGNFGAGSESLLYKSLKNEKDDYYRLTIFKQTLSGKIHGIDNYAMWGWCLISKHKDKFLWETRYFQNGMPYVGNLDTRDPIEDTRRRHVREIPSGGIDYKW